MDDEQNVVFYFMFGYDHPDASEIMEHDASFDFESTGILPIRASNEADALRWGKCLARWYLSQLYRSYPNLACEWSPENYACWIESSLPDGCEDVVRRIGVIDLDSYPEFDKVKTAFHD